MPITAIFLQVLIIKNSECERLLGVKFDSKHTFDQHIFDLCEKAGRKVNALVRNTRYMNLQKTAPINEFFFSRHSLTTAL